MAKLPVTQHGIKPNLIYHYMKKVVLTVFVAAAFALISCENRLNSKVPVENIILSVICDGFTLGDDSTCSVECVSYGKRGTDFRYDIHRRKGQDADTLHLDFLMLDKENNPHDGFGWLGTTEIECSFATDEPDSKSLQFKLYVEGSTVSDGSEPICTAVIQNAEIIEGDFTCTLTPNTWDSRTSTEAVLRIMPAASTQQ